jgi:hypothetical protein
MFATYHSDTHKNHGVVRIDACSFPVMLLGYIELAHSLVHTAQAVPSIVVSNVGTYGSPKCYHGLVEFFVRYMFVALQSESVRKLRVELRGSTETLYRIVVLAVQ